jgi:hypothetical protein
MVSTEKDIQNTFKKLLEKYEFNEIDVNKICASLNIKRQTFYYHFKNIYDVIFSIYCYNKIPEVYDNDLNSIIRNVFIFLFQDQSFNLLIAKSNANDVLNSFISTYISSMIIKFLNKYNLRINDKKDCAKFFANGLSEICLYYFSQNEYSINESVKRISYLFNEDVLKAIIRKYQNSVE